MNKAQLKILEKMSDTVKSMATIHNVKETHKFGELMSELLAARPNQKQETLAD